MGDDEIDALCLALGKYEEAFAKLFSQCLSNPIYDSWGRAVDMTFLNEAHMLGQIALADNIGPGELVHVDLTKDILSQVPAHWPNWTTVTLGGNLAIKRLQY